MKCKQCGQQVERIAGHALDGEACMSCVIRWNAVQTAYAVSREQKPKKENVKWVIDLLNKIIDELLETQTTRIEEDSEVAQ